MSPEDWTERGDWLEGHMFDRRIVSLRGELDDLSATRIASQLMTLDGNGDEIVQLQLDCAGGSLEAGFAVVDVIDALGVPVSLVRYHHQSRLRFHERLAEATHRPVDVVTAACEAGTYMSTAEAIEFGLVDEIVRAKRAPVRALPGLH
jgi:ATP-dependent protease ClpP protease subunit